MSSTVTTPAFRQDFFATIQRQAALLVIGIPLVMALWVAVANFWTLDVIFTARAALMCCVPLLLGTIFYPLFTRLADREAIFIVAWFMIAMFFNIWWEMPQVIFMETFQEANRNLTLENLPWFIAWWGYTTSDLDYFNLTRYFILAELSFWVVNLLAIFGLVHMWKGQEFKAMVWFCLCGALQIYNVTCIFLPYGGIVEQFENIATDSPLAIGAYWIMNLMWVVAAAVATRLAFLRVIGTHTPK